MQAYAEMDELFTDHFGVAPPIPACYRPHLVKLDDWAYSSDASVKPGPMYMFRNFAPATDDRPAYVAVAHSGHGINSYAITYQLVHGPLAVFAQTGWGGVYMDPERSAQGVRAMFEAIAGLVSTADITPETAARPRRRLIVGFSSFRDTAVLGEATFVDEPDVAPTWTRLTPAAAPGTTFVPPDDFAQPLADLFGQAAELLRTWD